MCQIYIHFTLAAIFETWIKLFSVKRDKIGPSLIQRTKKGTNDCISQRPFKNFYEKSSLSVASHQLSKQAVLNG